LFFFYFSYLLDNISYYLCTVYTPELRVNFIYNAFGLVRLQLNVLNFEEKRWCESLTFFYKVFGILLGVFISLPYSFTLMLYTFSIQFFCFH